MDKVLYYQIKIKGVDDEKTSIGKLDVAIKNLTKELNELTKAKEKNSNKIGEVNVKLALAKKQRSELLTEVKKSTVAYAAEEGSLIQMEIALQKANLAYRQMGKARRESAEGNALLASIKAQTIEISKLEQATGRFQRQVGNYNTAGVAMSQVLREIPAFTFSAQTGILALSNNIPILVDEMRRISTAMDEVTGRKKGWVGAFKEMGANLFSLGGVMTIALGLFTIFSDEIFKFIKGTEKAAEATKTLKTEQEALNEAIRNFYTLQNFGKDALGNATTDYKNLSEVLAVLKTDADKSTVSVSELNSALAASKEQLANLKLEGTNIAGIGEMVTDTDRAQFEATKKRILANIDLLQSEIDKRTKSNREKSKKEKKESAKEDLDLVSEIQEAEINLIEDKYIKSLYLEMEDFRQKVDSYEKKKKEYPKQEKELNRLIFLAQLEHLQNMKEIQEKAAEESRKEQSETRTKRLKGLNDDLDAYEKWKADRDADEVAKEKKKADEIKQVKNNLWGSLQEAENTYFQMQEDAIDRHLKRQMRIIEQDSQRQTDVLKNRLDKGLISEAQYNADKAELDRQAEEKRQKAERAAFEEQKRLAKAKIAVDTSVAIIKGYAEMNWVAATIQGAALTALGALQIAAVDAQEFAEGGLVLDKNRNIPTKANGDNVLTTLTAGEIVLNKRQQAMLGGNETFAKIGVPNVPNIYPSAASGGSVSGITKKDLQAMVAGLGKIINNKKVINLESENKRVRDSVANYEAESKW